MKKLNPISYMLLCFLGVIIFGCFCKAIDYFIAIEENKNELYNSDLNNDTTFIETDSISYKDCSHKDTINKNQNFGNIVESHLPEGITEEDVSNYIGSYGLNTEEIVNGKMYEKIKAIKNAKQHNCSKSNDYNYELENKIDELEKKIKQLENE